jgi:translation initiation factor 2 subunit 2
MKKKKKSSKKKAAFDLEAFEKELNESKKGSEDGKKAKDDDDDDDDGPIDTSHLDQVDETELGENPFSRPDAPIGVDAGTEPWLTSDRDYAYPEVIDLLQYRNPA